MERIENQQLNQYKYFEYLRQTFVFGNTNFTIRIQIIWILEYKTFECLPQKFVYDCNDLNILAIHLYQLN